MRTAGALIAAAALMAGCGTGGSFNDWTIDQPTVAMTGMTIHVENHRPSSMRIFAVRGGAQMFVGEVGARERRTFTFPAIAMSGNGPLRLIADPPGSTLFTESEPVELTDGRHVEWLLRKAGNRVRVK